MSTETDQTIVEYEDECITVFLNPPQNIGGWNIQTTIMNHFGSTSGRIVKSVASGFSAVSGITILNSGNGQFKTKINSVDTSGMEFGNYAYVIERLDSGCRKLLFNGYFIVDPNRGL